MKLYADPITTSCRAVIAILHETGIEVERHHLSLARGEQFDPAYRAINPDGKVPVLLDGSFRLTESTAIARYLCAIAGSPLVGGNRQSRARVDERLAWLTGALQSDFCGGLVYPEVIPHMRWDDPAVASATHARALAQSEAALDRLNDRLLTDAAYVAGDHLTIADFFGVAVLSMGAWIGFGFERWPNVARWTECVTARDSWRRLEGEMALTMPSAAERAVLRA
jgi:glutathione S-transferase